MTAADRSTSVPTSPPPSGTGPYAGRQPVVLPAYGDRTVSMIRAKYENRATARFRMDAEAALTAEIERVAKPRFFAGKCIARSDVSGMERLFSEAYEDAPFLVTAKDEERLPTRVKPRSWAVCRTRLFAAADDVDRLVRIHATSLTATRKSVTYRMDVTLNAWTFHAQERLHERTPDHVRADRAIAEAVLDNAALIQFAKEDRPADEVPRRLAVPCGDGLLLGEIQEVPRDTLVSRRVACDGARFSVGRRLFGQRVDEGMAKRGRAETTRFVGVTYVGADEMGGDQRALRREMAEIGGMFVPLKELVTEAFMGLGLASRVRNAKGGYEDNDRDWLARTDAAYSEEGVRRLDRLLADGRMLRAMGN